LEIRKHALTPVLEILPDFLISPFKLTPQCGIARRARMAYGTAMASGNPTLNDSTFETIAVRQGPAMTITGTVSKTGILLALVILGSTFTWNTQGPLAMPLMISGAIGGFIVALVTAFKREWAPVTAPLYALLEGLFLGGISAIYNAQFNGIVLQAVMLTFGVLAVMLALYQTRVIKVTEKLRMGIFAATGAIALVYLVSMVLGIFGIQIPGIFGNGTIGIVFSLVVVGIAAFNLVLDFDVIDQGIAAGAPRYMEWYCGFGLMVTLIWLYLEILRLLSKLQRR
jgi:uncharacterized YccA/Bax inhibitor family protein